MKDLKQLIAEQKEAYLDKYNTGDNWLYRLNKKEDCYYSCGSEVLDWHTTSLKSLLLALREKTDGMKKDGSDETRKRIEKDGFGYLYERLIGYNTALSDISTLITEAINSLEE